MLSTELVTLLVLPILLEVTPLALLRPREDGQDPRDSPALDPDTFCHPTALIFKDILVIARFLQIIQSFSPVCCGVITLSNLCCTFLRVTLQSGIFDA